MRAIRKIARWVLFFSSMTFIIPFPSDAKEPLTLSNILISLFMALLTLDMLLLILQVQRKRVQVLLEFVLYPAFIALLVARIITSGAIASLTSSTQILGGIYEPLLLFTSICGLLITAAWIVLLDAKDSYYAGQSPFLIERIPCIISNSTVRY